jgi:methylmalonyl-CoA decarboxylase subunit alpha
MVKGSSYMCITGPDVIKAVIGEEVTHEELGGASAHALKSGVCHVVGENDKDCIDKMKKLLFCLPDSCHGPLLFVEPSANADRHSSNLDRLIPDRASQAYDVKQLIVSIADDGIMFELHEMWATNIVVCFIRIMGRPVGVIANNPNFLAGVLDTKASDKASRFIRFCDAFGIPLLTFADVPGYMPGTSEEWSGIISHGAKLLHAYAEATVPKLTAWLL